MVILLFFQLKKKSKIKFDCQYRKKRNPVKFLNFYFTGQKKHHQNNNKQSSMYIDKSSNNSPHKTTTSIKIDVSKV